jgi:hypothetical protein
LDSPADRMVAITVTLATVIGNRYGGSQSFDSNGPNIKIRRTPHQIFERYIALAREASTSDDRVAAENLYQHAEHYFRVMNAANEGHQRRTIAPADLQTEMSEGSEVVGPARSTLSDRQPYSA